MLRSVPNSKEAEQSVLGAAFISKSALQKVCEDLLDISKTGKIENPYRYFGVRKEAEE